MSDVSVVGCGAMGSALIRTLADNDNRVTVWNRTREKAEALAGPMVAVAETADDAFAASPLSIVCVAHQDAARSLLAGAPESLGGRAVASTSFVTPGQAREIHELLAGAGGHYLDLAIAAYPSSIGTDSAFLFLSGDRGSFEQHRQRFEQLGSATYVSEDPGSAYVSEMAVVLPYAPMAVSLLQAAKICEHHGLPLEWFAQTAPRILNLHVSLLVQEVTRALDPSTPAQVEASIQVVADGAAEYAAYLREMNLDSGMYDALHRLFADTAAAGYGQENWTSVAELTTNGEVSRPRAPEG